MVIAGQVGNRARNKTWPLTEAAPDGGNGQRPDLAQSRRPGAGGVPTGHRQTTNRRSRWVVSNGVWWFLSRCGAGEGAAWGVLTVVVNVAGPDRLGGGVGRVGGGGGGG